jgi:formylglycine-generating enzyme required for sulfatase activity
MRSVAVLVMGLALFHAGCRRASDGAPQPTTTRSSADTASAPSTPSAPPPAAASAGPLSLDLGNGVNLELLKIPAGEFLMGTRDSGFLFDEDERPMHRVTISRPFHIGKYEVTQAQWAAVMGGNPSRHKGDQLPVHDVTWDSCREFCSRLGERTGRTVRLPTEAEWEHACRAGTETLFSFGDNQDDMGAYGWYQDNTENAPELVGTRQPNPWGLHDMHGNVFEWCADWFDSTYYGWSTEKDPAGPQAGEKRVMRGGCWYMQAWSARSAFRAASKPSGSNEIVGFRVVVE